MRIAVIYDFGVNKGGGDYVMLNILEALSEHRCDVSLLTSNPTGIYMASEFFNKEVDNIEIHNIKVPRYLRHPYTITHIAKKAAQTNSYNLFILSDDVPKCLNGKRAICYVHYPHAARLKFKEYVANKYKRTLTGRLVWNVHKFTFPLFYVTQNFSTTWFMLANSTLTLEHLRKTFKNCKAVILHPPVASAKIRDIYVSSQVQKENLIVSIGRFEPERRFEDVIEALRLLLKKGFELKLSIIGFSYDRKYQEFLRTFIGKKNLENKVEFLEDIKRDVILDRLLRAKVLVHTAIREPFGIAVVEGMAAGCIPVVRKGFNGPWIDITQEGRYGIGFESVEDLALAIETIINAYENFIKSKNVISRALQFDEKIFNTSFVNVVNDFLHRSTKLCELFL
jgi:glycosyltransferase involved in cell wall biosynthesis